MFDNYRIVSVTPAGRRQHLQILAAYLLQENGLIDEHQWWLNTNEDEDQNYLRHLNAQHPSFFKIVESDAPCPTSGTQRNRRLNAFYARCVDPKTIYLKIDDDICYLAPDALRELLQFRVFNPEYFLVYANTVNSPFNTYIHQRIGAFRTDKFIDYAPDGNAWHDSDLAVQVHRAFLSDLESGQTQRWCFERWEMPQPERFSINCCAWFGSHFRSFGGQVEGDDEEFLSQQIPQRLSRQNVVCGRALVAHFAFYTQIQFLAKTDLLARYRQHAPTLAQNYPKENHV